MTVRHPARRGEVGESVKTHGAVGDGVTDDSAAFNAASAIVEADGGVLTIPPGSYMLSSQWAISAPGTDGRIKIDGYGAELLTTGAISALEINLSSGDTNGGVDIYGLKVNHRNNSDATYGFNCDETWNTRFFSCSVEASATSATYAAWRVGNNDATDGNTGSFWTSLYNCWTRPRSGADGLIPVGVLLEGNANATNIIGGGFMNCDDGVLLSNQGTSDPIPNGVTMLGTDFEGCKNAIRYTGKTGVAIVGPRIISCRSEDSRPNEAITAVTKANPGVVTATAHGLANNDIVYIDGVAGMTELNGNRYTVANKADNTFELSGIDTSAFTTYTSGGTARGGTFFKIDTVNATTFAPYLCGNWIASSVADYIRNDNSIPITSLDNIITPDISGEGMTWTANTKITSESGSSWPLTLKSLGGARGLLLENSSGGTVLQAVWTGTGTGARLRTNSGADMAVSTVQGISSTATDAENIRGTVTLSSGTAAVSFGTNEPDATYFIVLGGDTAETFTWASKAVGGFTINSSNGSSTAVVDWVLIR